MPETKDKLQKLIDSFQKTTESVKRLRKTGNAIAKPQDQTFKYRPAQKE